MNTQVCQNCGALIRRLGSKCASCGNIVTAHSSTSVLQLAERRAPDTVAVATDPMLAEKMLVKLHHAASEKSSAANEERRGNVIVATDPLAELRDLPVLLNGILVPPLHTVERAEQSAPHLDLPVQKDPVSNLEVQIAVTTVFQTDTVTKATDAQEPNAQRANVQETNVQETNVQETNVQETNVQETNVQETNVQETNVQETNVQETNVQETNVQETNVQETNVQETNAQQTNAQETNAQATITQAGTAPVDSAEPRPSARDFFAEVVPTFGKRVEPTPADESNEPGECSSQPVQSFNLPLQSSPPPPLTPQSATKYKSEQRIELKEADSTAETETLVQRLIDSKMQAPQLAEETGFFENKPAESSKKRQNKRSRDHQEESKSTAKKNQPDQNAVFKNAKFIAGIACITVPLVLVFVVFVAGLFSTASPEQPKPIHVTIPSVQGTYNYQFRGSDGIFEQGGFQLNGDSMISGSGDDLNLNPQHPNYGKRKPFHLEGTYQAPYLSFTKTYDYGSNKSIVFEAEAKIDRLTSKIQLNGTWHFTGTNLTTDPRLQKQTWNALLFSNLPATHLRSHLSKLPIPSKDPPKVDLNPPPPPPADNSWFTTLRNLLWNDNDTAPNKFIRILLVCIVFGIFVMQLSLRFFGMHGLLNLWERQKYIPFAVRPQHLKLMKELGAGKRHGLLLGERVEWGLHEFWRPHKLYLPDARRERNPHLLAMGAGAKGKTRLLAGMIINDIKNDDRAVVVVDSEGSLVELVMRWLGSCPDASKILQRVSIIDPCRNKCTLGFNPLMTEHSDNLQAISSAVVMGFKSVYTESQNQQNQWTQQTANILRNAVLLLMLNNKTLEDLPVLLSDNDFRDILLEKVEKEYSREWKTLIDAWSNYKRLARTEQWINWIEPILNRVQPLLSDQRISRLLNARSNCVNMTNLLNEKRILLVRVPEGQLEKGGNLLGSLVVTGLRQAGLSQFERTGDSGKPCSLYLDEMNNFLDGEAFEAICSDLRKVQIGILATLKTLQDVNEEFRNRIQLNFGTMALFSISKKDADILGTTVFRVDGRKLKKVTPRDIFNPVNATPNMDFASDEEKMNINRLVGQEERQYFCHLVGTEAGVFRMKAPEFKDIARGDVNWDLIESIDDGKEIDEENNEE